MNRYVALPTALLMLGTGLAAAQTAPPAQPGPANPPSSAQAPCAPGAGNSPTVGSGGSSSNLSDKLANSNGVICPPSGVDPEMQKRAPGGGRMKIIPPPGGPDGDQNTIPK
jgi:hypothetical protein